MFPIRFKLCPQPEKAVQTESKDLLPSGNEDTTTIQQHESHRPLTGFDWGSYGYNEDLLSISSGSRTPFEFKPNSTFLDTENNNNNDVVQATDWFLVSKLKLQMQKNSGQLCAAIDRVCRPTLSRGVLTFSPFIQHGVN